MNRILNVARAELLSWHASFFWPLGIMASSFVINIALFASIGDEIPEGPTTGGMASLYITQFIVAWSGVQQYFGFTVGFNVTRRTFYLGTGLVMLLQSLVFGTLLYLAELVEHATGGWGIRVGFFDPLPVTHGNSPVNIIVYTVPMILVSFVGFFLGVVTTRWGTNGLFTLSIMATATAGLIALIVTWTHSWSAVGSWLLSQSGISLAVTWPLVLAAACAAAGYGLLRRAMP